MRPTEDITRNELGTITTFTSLCDGSVVIYASGTDTVRTVYRFRQASVNNPKSASGWRYPSNYFAEGYKVNSLPSGRVGFTLRWPASGCSQNLDRDFWVDHATMPLGTRLYPDPPPSSLVDTAVQKAYANLKNQKVNLSVAFAERRETMETLASGVTKIAQQVRNFRKSKPKLWPKIVKNEGSRLRKEWRDIPNEWLEMQYGWKPLMSDIQGSCQALEKRNRDNDAYRAHVTGTSKDNSTQTDKVDGSVAPYAFANYMDVIAKTKYSCKVVLYFNLRNPILASLSSLGITNPAELVWERVPFSFVVDWFLPVSGWLSAFDADFGWDYMSGSQTMFVRQQALGVWKATDNGPYSSYSSCGDASRDFWQLRRVNLPSPPAVGLPHFKNPLSAGHIANAMSLLVQAFR